jgi:hypothetical protein
MRKVNDGAIHSDAGFHCFHCFKFLFDSEVACGRPTVFAPVQRELPIERGFRKLPTLSHTVPDFNLGKK